MGQYKLSNDFSSLYFLLIIIYCLIFLGRLIDKRANILTQAEKLEMIHYGAESIIASKESTVTDESIDEILAKSKVRTDQLTEKLSSMDEGSLRNFTIHAPTPVIPEPVLSFPVYSCHDFEGIDYR